VTDSIKKGLLYGFIILSLIFFAWYMANLYYTFWGTSGDVELPNITNMPKAEAEKVLKSKHLNMLISSSRFDNTLPENTIITQEPLPGVKVKRGRDILVIISSGPDLCEVPKLTGLTFREGKIMLANYMLDVGKVDKEKDNTVEPDCILKQDPAPGSKVKKGAKVDLVINAGGVPDIKIPKFVGKNIKDVRSELNNLKLRVGEIKWEYSDEKDIGEVLWQSIDENNMVYPGTDISFKMSAGSRYIDLKLKQDNITFIVPASNKRMNVKADLNDITGIQTIYEGAHSSGDKINLFVSSWDNAEIIIYIDEKVIKRANL